MKNFLNHLAVQDAIFPLAVLLVFVAGAAMAQPQGGPPPEALDACKGKAHGASCSFTGRRGEKLDGQCFTPPPRPAQGASASAAAKTQPMNPPMACRPANHPGPDGAPKR